MCTVLIKESVHSLAIISMSRETRQKSKTYNNQIISNAQYICKNFDNQKQTRQNHMPLIDILEHKTKYRVNWVELQLTNMYCHTKPEQHLQKGRIQDQSQGERNNVRFVYVIGQFLPRKVYKNCSLTLKAMNGELRCRLPEKPNVNTQPMARHLEGMLYSLNLSRLLPADRNRPYVIERRHAYADWLLEDANIHHTVFISRCSSNIWRAKSHGRAPHRRPRISPMVQPENEEYHHLSSSVTWFFWYIIQLGWVKWPEKHYLNFSKAQVTTLTKMISSKSILTAHLLIDEQSSLEKTLICGYNHRNCRFRISWNKQ